MSDDAAAATVFWLDAGASAHDDAGRALAEWARARGVRLIAMDDGASGDGPKIDLAIGDRLEKELDRAREAIGSHDADGAERALARIETTLRDHPELPQAPWLRAEVERTWSARWLRLEPRDEARARVAWENAQALDGGRAAGVGEMSFPGRAKVKTTIVVAHPTGATGFTVLLDGSPIQLKPTSGTTMSAAIEIAPAEHQLLALDDGRIVFASWVAVANEPVRVALADGGGACGGERFSQVKRQDTSYIQASGVTCPHWIAAVPGDRKGSVLVAQCARDACGPLIEWRVERFVTPAGPPQSPDKKSGWPAWATWALLGVGAAAATSVAIVATGVFESRPVEPRFVVGGARQE